MRAAGRHNLSLAILALLLAWGFGPGAAILHAQAGIALSDMTVALWPEYDAPGVLVIYRGQLSPAAPLPVDVTFAIPAQAGKPSSTAGVDAQGNFRYRQYQMAQQGDQLLVTYSLPYRRFQFEYYFDPFAGQGAERAFEYTYRADYAVESFTLEVQEPAGAEEFATDPPADSVAAEAQFPVHTIQFGRLEAGQEVAVRVTYRKEDPRLAAEVLGLPTPSSVQFEDAPGRATGLRGPIIALIAGAAVLAAGVVGLALWTRSRRAAPMSRQARRRAARQTGRAPKPAASRARSSRVADPPKQAAAYCHQCGRALKADELFCPACGTRRKGM